MVNEYKNEVIKQMEYSVSKMNNGYSVNLSNIIDMIYYIKWLSPTVTNTNIVSSNLIVENTQTDSLQIKTIITDVYTGINYVSHNKKSTPKFVSFIYNNSQEFFSWTIDPDNPLDIIIIENLNENKSNVIINIL